MSAFKALKDASNNFEKELQHVSGQLFSAKIGESFEDVVSKKVRDLSLFTSKVRLLHAKPLSLSPQITSQEKSEVAIISAYSELATWKIIDMLTAKSLMQGHAVKTLITASSKNLHPELVERKEKIIKHLLDYREQESLLQHLDEVQKRKEDELAEVRARWDIEVGALRDIRAEASGGDEVESSGPLYTKLQGTVAKLELMRWLISKLVAPRTRGYDWLADPRKCLAALKVARTANTVDVFLADC